jgi:serine/threonine-protein kinase HipA
MQVEVWVELEGHPVRAGTHAVPPAGNDGSGSFSYTPDYIAMPGGYPLDPLLPLGVQRQSTPAGQGLFGAMADSTPDGWGRTLLDRREAALAEIEQRDARSLREVDYLLGVRDDLREGALRFRVDEGPFLADEEPGVPGLADLPSLLDLVARAEADAADRADLAVGLAT